MSEFGEHAKGGGRARGPFGKSSTPKNWGEISWLVMGSGGMVSTTGDLYALMEAVRAGKWLSGAAQEKFWMGGVLAGGSDRGFLTLYTEGPGLQLVFYSNSHGGGGDLASQNAEALALYHVVLLQSQFKGSRRIAR